MKMKVILPVCVALACALVAVLTAAAARQGDDQLTLGQRVTSLEQRVTNLEARMSEVETPRSAKPLPLSNQGKPGKADIAPWRSLEKGMTMTAVKKLLGEPKHVMMFNEAQVWDYEGGGAVRFDKSGRVEGWYEP